VILFLIDANDIQVIKLIEGMNHTPANKKLTNPLIEVIPMPAPAPGSPHIRWIPQGDNDRPATNPVADSLPVLVSMDMIFDIQPLFEEPGPSVRDRNDNWTTCRQSG
jgi:hypothetical protein